MRVYFDASVIIAALLSPNGGSSLLIKFVQRNIITGITSQTVIDEVLDVNKLHKLKHTRSQIEHFIAASGLLVREAIDEKLIKEYRDSIDPKDAHLVAGARLTGCSHLVTLDKKHLLRVDIQSKFSFLCIVSPKEVLEEIVLR